MPKAVFLDSGPLGLVTNQPGKSQDVDDCLLWVEELTRAGIRILVPEVADYIVRRELVRAGKTSVISRLNEFNTARTDRYVPITTDAMLLAADLWANARNAGVPTADARALDADVVLAAQALTSRIPQAEIIVATVNVRHISRFVASEEWRKIRM